MILTRNIRGTSTVASAETTNPTTRYSSPTVDVPELDAPNVLIVFPDQWRNAAIGRHSDDFADARAHPDLHTPRLDRFIGTGWNTRNHVTANPVCSPNRSALLTGRHPHATRVIQNNLEFPKAERSLAEALRDVGYKTGYIGKWHLGPGGTRYRSDIDHGYVPPDYRNGFDDWWEGFTRNTENEHKGHFVYNADGRVKVVRNNDFQPTIQTDRVIDTIDQWAGGSEPWLIQVNYDPPHPPFVAPARYRRNYPPNSLTLRPNVPSGRERTARELLSEYYGLIQAVDTEFGRLLDALNKRDIASDTLIIFASDHGEGGHSNWVKGKKVVNEESINVPLAMRWGNNLANRQDAPTVVSTVDLAPTVVGMVNATGRDAYLGTEGRPVQGRDLSGFLFRERHGGMGGAGYLAERAFVSGKMATDQEWRAIRKRRWVLSVDRHLETEKLYDLWNDPYQQNNRAGEGLRIERRLRNELQGLFLELDDRVSLARR